VLFALRGSFAVAMGPVVWVVLAEIFPTQIRGRAMAVATVILTLEEIERSWSETRG
jgi:hypothetical protein